MIRSLFFAGAVVVLVSNATFAQDEPHRTREIALSPIDCSVLSGTPYVCVRNGRHTSITNMSCIGFWGESPLSLPGGNIPSGGTSVVAFTMGKCNKDIQLKTRDGQTFDIKGFDTERNTVLNVSDN